jgi:hypothetical protein
LLALGIVEVPTGLTHRVVVAMHPREGLFADVAVALLAQMRSLDIFRLRRLKPQWRID